MKPQKISRWFGAEFETRAANEENKQEYRLIARPIVFDQRTDLGYCYEIIERGALDNADLKDVLLCANHDIGKIPFARSRNNNSNSTMQLQVDDKGMLIDAVLDTTRNVEASALYSAVDRGDMSGCSFMFRIDGYRYEDLDTDKPTRIITSISKVYEVSVVNFPAYQQTTVDARNNSTGSLASEAEMRAALESARSLLVSKDKQLLELEKIKLEILTK